MQTRFNPEGRIDSGMPARWAQSLYFIFRDIAKKFVEIDNSITDIGGSTGFTPTLFSAALTTDQTSGTRVKFNDVATNHTINYAGYSTSTGVLTIGTGDGGNWTFGTTVEVLAGTEASGLTREMSITLNGGTIGASEIYTFAADDVHRLIAVTGPIDVADADAIAIDFNVAASSGTSGTRYVGAAYTRFWAMRLGD